ncbi:MAG: hypothetical protein ACI8QZ_000179 [Chlamydiales bacterium]|jgi:hypothetical protein
MTLSTNRTNVAQDARILAFCALLLTACERPNPAPENGAQGPWFQDMAAARGIDFVHESGHGKEFYPPEIVAGGVALLDMDGDGDLDIYLVQSGRVEAENTERPGNQLYRNLGEGTFENCTADSGADDRGYGMGAATGDFDNDGFTDIYVTNLGRNALLKGSGEGTFTDVTDVAGVGDQGFGSSAAFVDFDHDGDLDLYVANYLAWSVAMERECSNSAGQRDYCAPGVYNAPSVDVLYRNEGDGTFEDVTEAAGLSAGFGTGLGLACGDFTGDGLEDFFVANDGRPDQLWVNLGEGQFEDRGLTLGCALDNNGVAKAGMGVAAGDIDDDGDLDLLVSNLRRESDSLFINRGTHFEDATAVSGLGLIGRAFTRFGTGWADFDNDGVLDLYQANGRVVTDVDGHGSADPFAEPNLLYRGILGGRFEEVARRGGTAELLVHTSRGAAFGDLDNDGSIDVVVVNRDGAPYLLLNTVSDPGHWLMVRVLDEHGRDALGASVTIELDGRTLRRDVRTAYSYCAASDARVHFGLGSHTAVGSLAVRWVDGLQASYPVSGVDRVLEIRREDGPTDD